MIPLGLLSDEDRRQIEDLTKRARKNRHLTLMDAMRAKLILGSHFGLADAVAAYRKVVQADDGIRLHRLRIRGLLQSLRDDGDVLHVFHEGGVAYACRPPRFFGPGSAPTLQGTPRVVFAGVLSDVTVHSRSPAIRRGDELIFDLQPGELDSVPTEMAFDPMVFRREGLEVHALEDSHPDREWQLDRAWSLMGINSVSFGHWMIEQLPQFLAASELPEFAGVPILIDQRMPPQHRESLEVFGQGRFPILEVPRGIRVQVGRLHVMSNWMYAPHLMTTDQGLDVSTFVPPVDKMAAVYARAARGFEQLHPAIRSPGVFWARDASRHRSIGNQAAVEALLEARGIARHLPEAYGFAEQVARLRGADVTVLQNGSGMHGFFLARAGTRVCLLSHPSLPFIALFNELLQQMGHELTVVTGPFVRRGDRYLDQSDYEVPLDKLQSLLESC